MGNAAILRDLDIEHLEQQIANAKERLVELENEREDIYEEIDELECELAKWTEPDDEPRWDEDDD